MAHSADRSRTSFSGTAYLHGKGGSQRPYLYKASYSKPRRDRQGWIRFGWTATVVGVDLQPQPRTTIVDEPPGGVEAEFVEQRIQRSIEEHLAVLVAEPQGKIC